MQKHKATSLHYDFRLQMGNVMPSWAVPKGPSLDNTVKRLAMKVDDHDLEYRKFEGVLPKGGYGAGPVMIWDEGYYIPEVEVSQPVSVKTSPRQGGVRKEITDAKEGEKMMEEGIKKGEIKFFLHGKKLKGSFALVKTHGFAGKNAWLLIKHNDKYVQKGFDPANFPTSAKSGKRIEEIK